MSAVVWLRCRRRFVRTHGTWPEHQAKVVAGALEASGIPVRVLPDGERPLVYLGRAVRLFYREAVRA